MKLTIALKGLGLIMGFFGAGIIWQVSSTESPSLPFYADSEGMIIAGIAAKQRRRDVIKNSAMALIAAGFAFQVAALFF